MTNEQHNQYLSWAFIGHAIFQGLIALMMILMMEAFLSVPDDRGGPPPEEFAIVMFGLMSLVYVGFAVPSVIAAYGIRKKKKWARFAAIVAGTVAAMNFPIGTASCVYAMWFFLGDNWKDVYPEVAIEKENRNPELLHEREIRWTGHYTNEKGELVFNTVTPPDWR
jgi:hypothetical protein